MPTAQELFDDGNAALAAGDYKGAVQKFDEAIKLENKGEYYLKRSVAHCELQNYQESLKDASEACNLMKDNSECFLYRGKAHFFLNQTNEAKEDFEKSLALSGDNDEAKTLIAKCNDALTTLSPSSTTAGDRKKDSSSQSRDAPTGPNPLDRHMPSAAKARFDWYQTETHVVVTLLIKNAKKENVDVHITPTSISTTVKLPSGSDYSLELDLAHPIVPEKSITRVMATKIEIKLLKADDIRWSSLESDNESQFVNMRASSAYSATNSSGDDSAKKYPSSAQRAHDWDKIAAEIAKEEENEKEDGDAALNKLFQKIYSDGNEDVRKAMNKSFVESGGTVLSTNWKEVGKGHVDCKPPDGMEYKKYEI